MSSASPLDGSEPIADDELIYRRIPVSQNWYDAKADPKPLQQTFRPRAEDITGLSDVRGEPYNTPEQAAQGLSKRTVSRASSLTHPNKYSSTYISNPS